MGCRVVERDEHLIAHFGHLDRAWRPRAPGRVTARRATLRSVRRTTSDPAARAMRCGSDFVAPEPETLLESSPYTPYTGARGAQLQAARCEHMVIRSIRVPWWELHADSELDMDSVDGHGAAAGAIAERASRGRRHDSRTRVIGDAQRAITFDANDAITRLDRTSSELSRASRVPVLSRPKPENVACLTSLQPLSKARAR